MTSAQASVGVAAAWPTTGTILITAEATRHGAATRPQPLRHKHMARTTRGRIALSPNDRGLVDSHLSGLGPRGTIHSELNHEDVALLCHKPESGPIESRT